MGRAEMHVATDLGGDLTAQTAVTRAMSLPSAGSVSFHQT